MPASAGAGRIGTIPRLLWQISCANTDEKRRASGDNTDYHDGCGCADDCVVDNCVMAERILMSTSMAVVQRLCGQ